jgi:uncharacterized protein (DUF2252 family)
MSRLRSLALVGIAAPMLGGCAEGLDDAREAEIVSALVRADEALIRSRPALVAGKYALMARDPYSYYRGTLPVYRHDWERGAYGLAGSAFAMGVSRGSPLALGDPHPENFGVLLGDDGSPALEPNDFDSADRAPYLWDLRRLVAGVSLAARLSNADDPAARALTAAASRQVARAAAKAYAETLVALARGALRERLTDPGPDEPVLADVFKRSKKNAAARSELADLTTLEGPARRLRRGVLSADDPGNRYEELPDFARSALPATLDAYRRTLLDPPSAAFFTVLDAARELGSGVASWPRVRVVILVRGPTDDPGDDVLLELKELSDARLLPLPGPDVAFDSNQARVAHTTHAAWFSPRSAPLWGTSSWLGLPVQVRLESEGQKTVRVSRLVGARGTAAAIGQLAGSQGRLLARVHAAPLLVGEAPAAAIAAAIGADLDAFADEQAAVGDAYAARVLADQALFGKALSTLGPRLGVPVDAADTPPPELAALFGAPPVDP